MAFKFSSYAGTMEVVSQWWNQFYKHCSCSVDYHTWNSWMNMSFKVQKVWAINWWFVKKELIFLLFQLSLIFVLKISKHSGWQVWRDLDRVFSLVHSDQAKFWLVKIYFRFAKTPDSGPLSAILRYQNFGYFQNLLY